MIFTKLSKLLCSPVSKNFLSSQVRKCQGVFGIKDLISPEKFLLLKFMYDEEGSRLTRVLNGIGTATDKFVLQPVTSEYHGIALDLVKEHYLKEHVLVRARSMDLYEDRALDEFLVGIINQGNTILATTENERVAGICVSYATSPVDVTNLRRYAFYRQDPNTKDFLYFTAKLQETPNLWEVFKQPKIFEVKMVAVLPEYRRQGLAVSLVDRAIAEARDQGYHVVRMDCINPHDYKIAERCMLQCIAKFPLHKLRGPHAPFIKRHSIYNRIVRVHVAASALPDAPDIRAVRRIIETESYIE